MGRISHRSERDEKNNFQKRNSPISRYRDASPRRSRSRERNSTIRSGDKQNSFYSPNFSTDKMTGRFEEKKTPFFEPPPHFETSNTEMFRFSPPDHTKNQNDKDIFLPSDLFHNQILQSNSLNPVSSGQIWDNSNRAGQVLNFSTSSVFESNLPFQQRGLPVVKPFDNGHANLGMSTQKVPDLNPQKVQVSTWNIPNQLQQHLPFQNLQTLGVNPQAMQSLAAVNKGHQYLSKYSKNVPVFQGDASKTPAPWSIRKDLEHVQSAKVLQLMSPTSSKTVEKEPPPAPQISNKYAGDISELNRTTSKYSAPPPQIKNEYAVDIPEFNPETSKYSAQEWLQKIDTIGNRLDWKSDEKKFNMTSRLLGFARQWYLTASGQVLNLNWNDFKDKFIEAFPTEMDFHTQLSTMINRKKQENESMSSYFTHKLVLINTCEITGRKAVSCILGGLPIGALKNEAKEQNFNDPRQLYNFLHTRCPLEENKNLAKPEKQFDYSLGDWVIACEQCHDTGHTSKDCPKKIVSKCSFCNSYDHILKNCTKTIITQCQFCEEFDHTEETCRNNPEVSKNKQCPTYQVMYGALGNKVIDRDCFVNVTVNKKWCKGYVDVGENSSDCVTIREGCAKASNVVYKKGNKIVRGFQGSTISSHGEGSIRLTIDRAIGHVKAFVVPDHLQAVEVVVGKSFLDLPYVVLDKRQGCKVRVYQRMDNGEINFD